MPLGSIIINSMWSETLGHRSLLQSVNTDDDDDVLVLGNEDLVVL